MFGVLANQKQSTSSHNSNVVTQSVVTRVMPQTPVRNTSVASSSTSSTATFFQPVSSSTLPSPILPLPRENADVHEQARHWIQVCEPKYSAQQSVMALEKLKTLLNNSAINLLNFNESGDNAFHCAALANNKEFFELVFKNTKYQKQININTKSSSNSTPLSYAILNGHFDLAIQLIEKYRASIHVLVSVTVLDLQQPDTREDGTCGILRKALVQCLRIPLNEFTDEQKNSLPKLINLLTKLGLKFFETKGSSCPASIEFNSTARKISDKDREQMEKYKLTEEQYQKLCIVYKLQQKYPDVFKLFWDELELVKNDLTHSQNFYATDLWDIWQHRQNANAISNLKSF